MNVGGQIFFFLYFGTVLGVTIFVLSLIWRFVRAHERMANSLETIARKLRNEGDG